MNDDADIERWVTVSEAAELSGISGSAIRQWYRSGRIPTQRADGDRGAFLVPLADVIRLGEDADAAGDDLGDPVLDLNASYWSLETAAAREEAAAARNEVEEVRRQLVFLRDQLAEATAAEREATARAHKLETELATLRKISAATSSITDSSWLELATNRYESPVRSQGMQPSEDMPVAVVGAAEVLGELVEEAEEAAEAEAEGRLEHFHPGEHADDLLPAAEKKGRRGRR